MPTWKKLEENCKSFLSFQNISLKNFLATFALNFQPCFHKYHDKVCSEKEQCCLTKECGCFERGYCDKYCGCDLKKCKIRYYLMIWRLIRFRRKGCDCKSNCMGKKCPCYSLGLECDPDLCKCCFNTKDKFKTNNCTNQAVFFKKSKVSLLKSIEFFHNILDYKNWTIGSMSRSWSIQYRTNI